MPATRKAVEILAPRTSLTPLRNPDAGNHLFEAVRGLIDQGVDPEIALEASLRRLIHQRSDASPRFTAAGIGTERGRESA